MKPGAIAFVWENFGPTHIDRVEAVAERFKGRREVLGIELAGKSTTYQWTPASGTGFRKLTLFPGTTIDKVGFFRRTLRTVRALLTAQDIFFCHYEHAATFASALLLRMTGRNVYVMNDSKLDDYPRRAWRERLKRLLYLPYRGGIAAGARSRDYMKTLGIPETRIFENYDNISVARVRRLGGAPPAPEGTPWAERHFTVVARLVEKKNLFTVLAAFSTYAKGSARPRKLHLIGSGPLEATLRARAGELGISGLVQFRGYLESEEVCRALAHTLALILASTEEQFGIAALEAIAMGVPPIVSENCGVRDSFVRDRENGFVVRADDAETIAENMAALAKDEALWRRMAEACAPFAGRGDVFGFAQSVNAVASAGLRRAK